MKKHAIAAVAAALLASAVSYAQGETVAPSSRHSQQAMQFADQFGHLQGVASNSSAFMQQVRRVEGSTRTSAGSTPGAGVTGPHDGPMAQATSGASTTRSSKTRAKPGSADAAAMQHDGMGDDEASRM